MAIDKWTLIRLVVLFLVSSIGNIDAQSCGGNYTTDYGFFMSPNYPNVYYTNDECIYRITPSVISSITFNFEVFELDRSFEDYVSVTCESDTSYVTKNFTYMSFVPPISMPSCSIARLYFYSDSARNFPTRGFRVQYQVDTEGCANTVFISHNGTISSPNYPQYYNSNENCTYSIFAPTSSSFTLNFQAFDLESDCERDWVQIRCDNSSYILPKYCGSTIPKPAFIRYCKKVLIWFHTDSSVVSSGFSLQYSVTPDGCGRQEFAGLSGIITSPNYPQMYNNVSCWNYLSTVSSVSLDFQSFDLEPYLDYNYGDFVEIYRHFTNFTSDKRRYIGKALPPMISCTMCYRVNLIFSGNYAFSGTGFHVRYQVNPLVAHSAITSSPKNFTVEVGSRVELNCTSDAIDYYPSWTLSMDGTDENTTVLSMYCSFTYSDDRIYSFAKGEPGVCNLVILNATVAETGIYTCIDVGLASSSSVVTVIDPTATPTPTGQVPTTTSAPSSQGCGGNYTTDYGVFMSPNYPNAYTLNVECVYRILPSTLSSITLSFETFELDRSSDDHILISCESDSSDVPRNFSWRSNIPPISLTSCTNGRLYFLSDSSRNFSTRGFRVQYQVSTKNCDNTVFTSSSGTIASPNYPQNYNDDENCTYSIWAQEISSFTLTFQAFDLESDCRYDWVQIRCDNGSYISPKYCDSIIPKPAYINHCKKVLIWFHTDSSASFSGFSLQYSVTPNGCGKQRYGGLTGILTSPNFPGRYDGMQCYYYVHPVSSITLEFQSFDLEPFDDNRYGDNLRIDAYYKNTSSIYLTYTGNTLPPMIICPLCDIVRLELNANWAISGTGYSIRYQTNPLVAHSAITTAPKNFTVDVGTRVQLNCTSDAKDYLPSWTLSTDGKDENTATVASFCDLNPYFPGEYITVTDDPGVCNLVILFATEAEAGIYTCIDVGLSSIVSVVTVVENDRRDGINAVTAV